MSVPLVEAEIGTLKKALSTGAITSVDLVFQYLRRIAIYDCNGPRLNSVCIFNPRVFQDAQASDMYRESGRPPRPLEGIPYVVKDSFKVEHLTVAAGSPAFANLISSADAAIVESLRAAGAVLIGKTNMPAMADGGGQRGAYGRAESPYNSEYSTTAFASGSSSGSGTSVAANFATFGFGGETVSSGRAPASSNALIGYSPSRGVISNRGQWPLYPTCDVIVPHTRTMRDMFDVLNVIVKDDKAPTGDFWRSQRFVNIPLASELRPRDYNDLGDPNALRGARIAIPKCFIGNGDGTKTPAVFSDSVRTLFDQARSDLESLGATLIETSFPLLENYDRKLYPGQSANVPGFTDEWNDTERCKFIAIGWDDFLRANGASTLPNLIAVNPVEMRPIIAPMDDPTLHTEKQNHVRYKDMLEAVRIREGTVFEVPGCEEAVRALEAARKRDLEDWLNENNFDCVVFPTNGDVPRADAEDNLESMMHALQDGVKYSNGGRALKHLGVPAITVPMGTMQDKGMPVGITFCTHGYGDNNLLRYAFAYENATKRRTTPSLTPTLSSDYLRSTSTSLESASQGQPILEIGSVRAENVEDSDSQIRNVVLNGNCRNLGSDFHMEVLVDGQPMQGITIQNDEWEWRGKLQRPKIVDRYPTICPVPKDQFMIAMILKRKDKKCVGLLILVK